DRLIEIAKRLHYSRRSYETLIEKAIREGFIAKSGAEKLLNAINENKVNLKKLDAIKVVEKVKEICLMTEKL
ncbi:MAG: hypothetical protein QXF06_05275, partial [Archaeoglobaceae archaeon]